MNALKIAQALAILATVAALSAPALALDISGAERAACKADYGKYCEGTLPGGGRIIACLAKHYASLNAACKKVVDAHK